MSDAITAAIGWSTAANAIEAGKEAADDVGVARLQAVAEEEQPFSLSAVELSRRRDGGLLAGFTRVAVDVDSHADAAGQRLARQQHHDATVAVRSVSEDFAGRAFPGKRGGAEHRSHARKQRHLIKPGRPEDKRELWPPRA